MQVTELPWIVMVAVCCGLNWRCCCRKVGYMSCVPCEIRFIIIISSTRYRNRRQCVPMARR